MVYRTCMGVAEHTYGPGSGGTSAFILVGVNEDSLLIVYASLLLPVTPVWKIFLESSTELFFFLFFSLTVSCLSAAVDGPLGAPSSGGERSSHCTTPTRVNGRDVDIALLIYRRCVPNNEWHPLPGRAADPPGSRQHRTQGGFAD